MPILLGSVHFYGRELLFFSCQCIFLKMIFCPQSQTRAPGMPCTRIGCFSCRICTYASCIPFFGLVLCRRDCNGCVVSLGETSCGTLISWADRYGQFGCNKALLSDECVAELGCDEPGGVYLLEDGGDGCPPLLWSLCWDVCLFWDSWEKRSSCSPSSLGTLSGSGFEEVLEGTSVQEVIFALGQGETAFLFSSSHTKTYKYK